MAVRDFRVVRSSRTEVIVKHDVEKISDTESVCSCGRLMVSDEEVKLHLLAMSDAPKPIGIRSVSEIKRAAIDKFEAGGDSVTIILGIADEITARDDKIEVLTTLLIAARADIKIFMEHYGPRVERHTDSVHSMTIIDIDPSALIERIDAATDGAY